MKRTALLALDDPVRASRLERMLAEAGLELRTCPTVGDALRALSSESFNLIFCEERLPDGTYRDVLRFFGPTLAIPLVVCADFYDKKAYIEAMSLGAFDYITLPYLRRDVEWIVGNAARKSARPSGALDREHHAAA
jgi:DNA-binding NtrC family response regulator